MKGKRSTRKESGIKKEGLPLSEALFEALLNSCRCTGQRGPVCANLPPEHILERRGFEDDPGAAGL